MSDRDRLERLIGIAGMLSATLCPLPPTHPPSQTPSLVVFIRHIISEVLQYRRHPWWPYRARRHPWSHRGALHYVLFLLSTHRARRHPWWSLFATCPREGYADARGFRRRG